MIYDETEHNGGAISTQRTAKAEESLLILFIVRFYIKLNEANGFYLLFSSSCHSIPDDFLAPASFHVYGRSNENIL